MWVGPSRKPSAKELMLSNCDAGEDCWEPLGQQADQTINPKRSQPWILGSRIVAEAEASILWSLDVKSWLIGKDSNAGKDWWQKEEGAAENEMVGWHHWLNGHEFEQTSGDSGGEMRLICFSPWCHKELATP